MILVCTRALRSITSSPCSICSGGFWARSTWAQPTMVLKGVRRSCDSFESALALLSSASLTSCWACSSARRSWFFAATAERRARTAIATLSAVDNARTATVARKTNSTDRLPRKLDQACDGFAIDFLTLVTEVVQGHYQHRLFQQWQVE